MSVSESVEGADSGGTWYVVSDTKAQIVNLVPAVGIGLDKIDHVLTLRGETKGALSGMTDRQQAASTHEWLRAAFEEERKQREISNPLSFHTCHGDKDDPAEWEAKVFDFFKEKPRPGKIVYVYTGGTKDMAIGVWNGLLRVQKDCHCDVPLEFVAKQSLRIYWPLSKHAIALTEGQNYLSLSSYLRLHGFVEQPQHLDIRLRKESAARQRREITFALASFVFDGSSDAIVCDRLLFLNSIARSGSTDLTALAQQKGAPSHLLLLVHRLRTLAAKLDGVSVAGGARGAIKLDCASGESGKYLAGGGWFEEWVWLRVLELAKGTWAEIALNLEISDCGRPIPVVDDEIDVAIYVNDELHLIECKTDRQEKRKSGQLHTLQSRKSVLSSIYGEAWLCNARPLEQGEHHSRSAERNALRFVAGPAMIEEMLKEIDKRLHSRR
jgi:hypothetical protein